MDNVKLGDKSKIEILDPTRVNQTSHTVNLRKKSEMYKDMTMKQFNKEVEDISKNATARGIIVHC
jgi:L-lactate utilization protein LutB